MLLGTDLVLTHQLAEVSFACRVSQWVTWSMTLNTVGSQWLLLMPDLPAAPPHLHPPLHSPLLSLVWPHTHSSRITATQPACTSLLLPMRLSVSCLLQDHVTVCLCSQPSYYLHTYLPVCASVCMPACLSISPSVCLSVCPSVRPSV